MDCDGCKRDNPWSNSIVIPIDCRTCKRVGAGDKDNWEARRE